MIRAAAKNYLRVAAVVDPADYGTVLAEIARSDGATTLDLRFRLARKAFQHTAQYDRVIAEFLESREPADARACYRFEA